MLNCFLGNCFHFCLKMIRSCVLGIAQVCQQDNLKAFFKLSMFPAVVFLKKLFLEHNFGAVAQHVHRWVLLCVNKLFRLNRSVQDHMFILATLLFPYYFFDNFVLVRR